jgi:hypothetical protein
VFGDKKRNHKGSYNSHCHPFWTKYEIFRFWRSNHPFSIKFLKNVFYSIERAFTRDVSLANIETDV